MNVREIKFDDGRMRIELTLERDEQVHVLCTKRRKSEVDGFEDFEKLYNKTSNVKNHNNR